MQAWGCLQSCCITDAVVEALQSGHLRGLPHTCSAADTAHKLQAQLGFLSITAVSSRECSPLDTAGSERKPSCASEHTHGPALLSAAPRTLPSKACVDDLGLHL